MAYFVLFTALVLNIGGNIAMKLAALRGIDFSTYQPIAFVAHNWQAIVAIAMYGLSAVFYFAALREIPLIIAYPTIIFLAFIAVHAFAVIFLGERIVAWQIVGHILVVAGMMLILFFAHKK